LQESSYIVFAPNPAITGIQVALGLRIFFLRRFTITAVLKTEGRKYKKNYKNFRKGATMNAGCDVKKQHSRSELKANPIYHLNQSRMIYVHKNAAFTFTALISEL